MPMRKILIPFFVALLLFFCVGNDLVWASDGEQDTHYGWSHYINPNNVSALTEYEGKLIVGTNGAGIAVRNWLTLEQEHIYTMQNSGLPGNIIEGFYEIEGRLFVVTNGGYCWFDGEKFFSVPEEDISYYLEMVTRGYTGAKYIGGVLYFLVNIDGQTQGIVKIDSHLNQTKIPLGLTVRDFSLLPHGGILVLSTDGIYRQQEMGLGEFEKILDLSPERLQGETTGMALMYDSLFYDGDNDTIWYSYRKDRAEDIAPLIFAPSYLVEYSNGESREYDLGNGVWPENVYFRNGKAIFSLKIRRSLDSTSDGLRVVKGNNIMDVENPDLYLMDFTGEVDVGFWYYEPSKNRFVLLDDDLQFIRDRSIKSEFSKIVGNSLVVFDDKGVYRIEGDKEVFSPFEYFPLERAYEIAGVVGNNVSLKGHYDGDWSGVLGGVKFTFEKETDGTGKYMSEEPALVDSKGNKWFRGLQVGLWYCIDPGGKEKIYSPSVMKGTPFYDFLSIDEGPDGNIWFLSSEGLTKVTPRGTFSYFMGKDILKEKLKGKPPYFREINVDASGDIWIYSDTLGLICFDGNANVKNTYGNLGAGFLQAFFIDGDGKKWAVMQGEQGLKCIILDKDNLSIEGYLAQGYIGDFENCRYYYDSAAKAHFLVLSTFEKEKERFGILKVAAGQNFDFYKNALDFSRSPNLMFTEIKKEKGYL